LNTERPLGVKVVSGILFADAAFLLSSVAAAAFLTDESSMKYQGFLSSIPYFRNNPLAITKPLIYVALAFAAWELAKGLGIWFMRQWARVLIIIDLLSRFGSLFMAVPIVSRKQFSSLASNADFVIGVVINLAALLLLMDSTTAQAFESRDH